jgi:hypothetical protein
MCKDFFCPGCPDMKKPRGKRGSRAIRDLEVGPYPFDEDCPYEEDDTPEKQVA